MDKPHKDRRKRKRKRAPQEILTAYDDDMNVIGDFPRSVVHYNKMWHEVVQCWIVRRTENGIVVYLQRRSFEKHSNPGRYDVSSGGHVSAGEDPETAMLREMREETGLKLDRGRLTEIGTYREVSGNDHELAHIFVYFIDTDPPFAPGEEVIYMVQADIGDLLALSTGTCDEITVVPAIRTGPMLDEAFMVGPGNFCNHESFVSMAYPFIMRCLGEPAR